LLSPFIDMAYLLTRVSRVPVSTSLKRPVEPDVDWRRQARAIPNGQWDDDVSFDALESTSCSA